MKTCQGCKHLAQDDLQEKGGDSLAWICTHGDADVFIEFVTVDHDKAPARPGWCPLEVGK